MDSLERLFFGISAFAALLALAIFGLYFDIGDMVLAAVKGPETLSEWAFHKTVRDAEKFGVPDEIQPGSGSSFNPGAPQGDWASQPPHASYNVVPTIPPEVKVARHRSMLTAMGFSHEEYLQMECLYRVERGHLGPLGEIEELKVRGEAPRALEELDFLIQQLNPQNHRALNDLLLVRGQLLALLNAPPEQIYDHVFQLLDLRKKILEIEIKGYEGVPNMRAMLAHAQQELAGLEGNIRDFEQRRSETLKFFATGVFSSGGFDPSFARMVRASVERTAGEKNVDPRVVQKALRALEAHSAAPLTPTSEPDGEPH